MTLPRVARAQIKTLLLLHRDSTKDDCTIPRKPELTGPLSPAVRLKNTAPLVSFRRRLRAILRQSKSQPKPLH